VGRLDSIALWQYSCDKAWDKGVDGMDGFWGTAAEATLAIVWLAVPLVAILVWIWRWSPREARKQLRKTLHAGGVEFGPAVYAWLLRYFIRNARLSMSTIVVASGCGPLIADWQPASWRFVLVLLAVFAAMSSLAVGSAFWTLRRSDAGDEPRRVAALRPRTVASYLHPAEAVAFLLTPVIGLTCLAFVYLARSPDGATTDRAPLLLATALIGLTVAVLLLLRRLVRLPQHARDEEEQLASDLLVSITLRQLLGGVVLPIIVVINVAASAFYDAADDLSTSGWVLAAVAVVLLAGFILFPSPARGQEALWRFRQHDTRVPA